MKFKVNDIVFHSWVLIATEVKIINCFPNTNRYRIQQQSGFQMIVKADEVFKTENELWQSKIDTINNKISKLEKARDEYKNNIIEE